MNTCAYAVVICALIVPQASGQSLAEAARKEAERRRQLAEQEVEAKVIEARGSLPSSTGNVTTFSRPVGNAGRAAAAREAKGRTSAAAYRRLLRKLDGEIVDCGQRASALRRQAEAEKWTLTKAGRRTGGPGAAEKLLHQAEELEARKQKLQRQRQEAWDEGLRAGYLPGELDGRAVAP